MSKNCSSVGRCHFLHSQHIKCHKKRGLMQHGAMFIIAVSLYIFEIRNVIIRYIIAILLLRRRFLFGLLIFMSLLLVYSMLDISTIIITRLNGLIGSGVCQKFNTICIHGMKIMCGDDKSTNVILTYILF